MKKLFSTIFFLLLSLYFFAEEIYDPTLSDYYIRGYYTLTKDAKGNLKYNLSDVSKKGFSFYDEGVWNGSFEDEDEVVKFTFRDASTTYPSGLNTKLIYWYNDGNQWQRDIEVKQGVAETKLTKQITITLVLDCSNSIGTDFQSVKTAALTFLSNMYSASSNGAINIGLVGFSTVGKTSTYDIKPLTSSTYEEMKQFIYGLRQGGGTALYYSMDKALNMMKNHAKNISDSKYDSSIMIVFTDGIDNTSMSKTITSADEYYKVIQSRMCNETIKGKLVDCTIASVKGSDIANQAQADKFYSLLNGLCSTVYKLKNFSELEPKFKEIADNLVLRWQTLNCYIPPARQGDVCWTFENIEIPVQKPVQEVKINTSSYPKHFIGVYASGNIVIAEDFLGGGGLGLEYAYMVKPAFGIGGYWGFDLLGGSSTCFQTQFGVQFVGGNLAKKKAAFIGSAGADLGGAFMGFEVRGGAVFRNGFFLSAGIGIGGIQYSKTVNTNYYDYGYSTNTQQSTAISAAFSIQLGYNFGNLIKN